MAEAPTRHRRSLSGRVAGVALVAGVAALASSGWMLLRSEGPAFSDDPRASRVAFGRRNGDVLILYHRCAGEELIPYVDAAEVIEDDLREWEVSADVWLSDEASWVARRHAVGEEDPPPRPFAGSLPPAPEVRLNVHVYSASIENRWHVRVEELHVPELPVVSDPSADVLTAHGEKMGRDDWARRAGESC